MALPTLRDNDLTLRPLAEEEVDRLVEIVASPGVVEWWSPIHPVEHTREGLVNEGRAFAIGADGELAGWLGFNEVTDQDCRHASLDIFLAPAYQERRLGRRALRLAIRWLLDERGHHRITIDPAVDNERAIRTYAAVGFRPVGVMRRYERRSDGEWHENLLMDLLAEEFRDGERS